MPFGASMDEPARGGNGEIMLRSTTADGARGLSETTGVKRKT
jgi:hypothetical protein